MTRRKSRPKRKKKATSHGSHLGKRGARAGGILGRSGQITSGAKGKSRGKGQFKGIPRAREAFAAAARRFGGKIQKGTKL